VKVERMKSNVRRRGFGLYVYERRDVRVKSKRNEREKE